MNWMNYKKPKLKASKQNLDLMTFNVPEPGNHLNFPNLKSKNLRNLKPESVISIDSKDTIESNVGKPGTLASHFTSPGSHISSLIAKTEDVDQDLQFYQFFKGNSLSEIVAPSVAMAEPPSPKTDLMFSPSPKSSRIEKHVPKQSVAPKRPAEDDMESNKPRMDSDKRLLDMIKTQGFQVLTLKSQVETLKETVGLLVKRVKVLEEAQNRSVVSTPLVQLQMAPTSPIQSPIRPQISHDSIQLSQITPRKEVDLVQPSQPRLVSILDLQPLAQKQIVESSQ